jgi:hypothetical protein
MWKAPAGITARLYSAFPDAAVAMLIGADRVHEFPVAVVGLGDGRPAIDATGPAASGEVDAAPLEFPLVTAAQRAGERQTLGRPWRRGDPVAVGFQAGAPVEAVVLFTCIGVPEYVSAKGGLPGGPSGRPHRHAAHGRAPLKWAWQRRRISR